MGPQDRSRNEDGRLGRSSPAVWLTRWTRTASRVARFGPTTPTRARRLADASVDPTEARKVSRDGSLVAAGTTTAIRETSIVSPSFDTRVVEYGLEKAEGEPPRHSTSGAVGVSPSPSQRLVDERS